MIVVKRKSVDNLFIKLSLIVMRFKYTCRCGAVNFYFMVRPAESNPDLAPHNALSN